MNPIRILYQDCDIVAVHKPAGLKVHRDIHPGPQERTILEMVRDRLGRWVYPVHRLDQPTSGLLLFALSPRTASTLAAAFASGQVRKTYLAVVRGFIASAGMIDYPLARDPRLPIQGQPLKPARTAYDRLATVEIDLPVGRYATGRYALVALYPDTGRMHQIRRHLHHISHPVIGDTIYGDGRHNRFFREQFACRRLFLAAMEMQIAHPRTGLPMKLQSPLEASFKKIVCALGWQEAVADRFHFV
jgi:tRNA pseudouridine65 synthase